MALRTACVPHTSTVCVAMHDFLKELLFLGTSQLQLQRQLVHGHAYQRSVHLTATGSDCVARQGTRISQCWVSQLLNVFPGAIEAVVKLVEAGSEGVTGQDSDVFKAEVVQHLLTLQVSHPQLREAIQEVQTCFACSMLQITIAALCHLAKTTATCCKLLTCTLSIISSPI